MSRIFAFKRHIIILGVCVVFLMIMVPLATFAKSPTVGSSTTKSAPGGYSFFGDAKLVTPGDASKHSVKLDLMRKFNCNTQDKVLYGGINFKIPKGMTFANIQTLARQLLLKHE